MTTRLGGWVSGGGRLVFSYWDLDANPALQATQMTDETAQRLLRFVENTEPVKRLRASQIASAFLGAVGFALFVVGVERAAEDIPVVSDPYGSIGVGVLLLLVTGLLLRKFSG